MPRNNPICSIEDFPVTFIIRTNVLLHNVSTLKLKSSISKNFGQLVGLPKTDRIQEVRKHTTQWHFCPIFFSSLCCLYKNVTFGGDMSRVFSLFVQEVDLGAFFIKILQHRNQSEHTTQRSRFMSILARPYCKHCFKSFVGDMSRVFVWFFQKLRLRALLKSTEIRHQSACHERNLASYSFQCYIPKLLHEYE